MRLVCLIFSLSVARSVKHSLIYFITSSSGVQQFPRLVIVGVVDGVTVGSCNSHINTIEGRQAWSRKLNQDNPHHLEWRADYCKAFQQSSKADVENLEKHYNETGGIHVLQRIAGCDWDEHTGGVDGYQEIGYDGEDFISFHVKNMSWLYSKKAASYREQWARTKSSVVEYNAFLIVTCPKWLQLFLSYGNSSMQRKDLPSVSVLQTSPSSPVSCYATGFYPHRAEMFWRKDGEQIHEDVDQGEILPNHDGTFQMRVDLDLSSVRAEDWRRYDWVFQLSGVKDDVITKLDKAVIRTNWVRPSEAPGAAVGGAAVGLVLLTGGVLGLFLWRRRTNAGGCRNVTETGSGLDLLTTE